MIFDMTKRQGGGSGFPYEYETGVATVSEASNGIPITLSKPLKNGSADYVLWFYGYAEGSDSWLDNWPAGETETRSQGWSLTSIAEAKANGLKTNMVILAYEVSLISRGAWGYYQSGVSFPVSNDGMTITPTCTRGNKFQPNINYHWAIIYKTDD